ncbi:small GTP-binding protein [Roseimicrobium gellanilyticum]|uniref:Small GTP-binding protein n=1 Tax=Roseimicrobium gellanilyticum TaxID=748857 RepID=A0A366HHZ0_9BACT|nr:dynamin family protein [Roseimicrobium gellanilyticum]RBP41219.1 small GTP-binding protein [Roseimicrobium gellanilyticum]
METSQGRMIGQDFLGLRNRLEQALDSLAQLAPDAGAKDEHVTMLDNLVKSLDEPFVFVVVGEVNVGKSTLLNALFGADLSSTGVIPTTDRIFFYKHGPKVKRVPITRTLEEVFVPVEFLKDFHVVDTPGTNSVAKEHQEITERFIPASDLVLFVFSAINPWGASAWQFLERVHKDWMRHVIFVLGQCDLRTAEEVSSILDYMKQLSRQRFGREFPVFPVSAKSAYLSRSSGLDRDRLYLSSGFPQLEAHISKTIGGNAQRAGKMAHALKLARELLVALQSTATGRIASREEKSRLLGELEAEFAAIEERSHSKLTGTIDASSTDFGRAAGEVAGRVQKMLSLPAAYGSMLKEKRSVKGLEREVLDQVWEPNASRWVQASKIIEDDVGAAADHLSGQFGAGLKVQVREELRPDASFWETHRHRLRQHLEDMLHRVVYHLGVEKEVAPVFARSRKLARNSVVIMLVALMGGIALVTQGLGVYGAVLAGVGLLSGGGLALACHRLLRTASQVVDQRLKEAEKSLHDALEGEIRQEVRDLYAGMASILQPTRERLAEQKKRHHTLQEQLADLDVTLRTIETELDKLSSQRAG